MSLVQNLDAVPDIRRTECSRFGFSLSFIITVSLALRGKLRPAYRYLARSCLLWTRLKKGLLSFISWLWANLGSGLKPILPKIVGLGILISSNKAKIRSIAKRLLEITYILFLSILFSSRVGELEAAVVSFFLNWETKPVYWLVTAVERLRRWRTPPSTLE